LLTSACDNRCHKVNPLCGNGMIDPDVGEDCDPGPTDSAGCNGSAAGPVSCKAARCGDGYANLASGERCDSGMSNLDTLNCNGKLCTLPACGDNYINIAAGEECESGGSDTRTCNGRPGGPASCRSARCGDGYINSEYIPNGETTAEACDNPGGIDTVTCNGNNGGHEGPGACQPPNCGDRYRNSALVKGAITEARTRPAAMATPQGQRAARTRDAETVTSIRPLERHATAPAEPTRHLATVAPGATLPATPPFVATAMPTPWPERLATLVLTTLLTAMERVPLQR
jgi:hypothetical protein